MSICTKTFVSGSQSLKLLDKLVHRIYNFNTGVISFEEVEDLVQDFLFHYQVFSHKAGLHKEDRKRILELQLTLAELGKNLKCLNRGRIRQIPNNSSCQENETTSAPDGDVAVESVNRNHEDQEVEDIGTPQKTKLQFVKVTPKADLMKTFDCHLCKKKYIWLKALRKHMKMQHNNAEILGNQKENEDKVTCRICSVKQSRDLIGRHLKDVHFFKKSNPNTVFRGFLKINGENWQPLFLHKNEDDPPTEFMAPVDENGLVDAYGIKFQIDGISKNGGKVSVAQGDDKNVPEIEPSEGAADNVVTKHPPVLPQPKGSGTILMDMASDEICEVSDGTVVKSVAEEHIQLEGSKSVDIIVKGKVTAPNEDGVGEQSEDSVVEEVTNIPQVHILSEASNQGLEKVHTIATEMVMESNEDEFCLLEEVEDMIAVSEVVLQSSKRKSVVRNLIDEFNDENDIRKEAKKPRKLENEVEKLVKVQVFAKSLKNGDFWSVEDKDSDEDNATDYDDSDTEEYTKSRGEMKRLRYEERNVSVDQTKVFELVENASIIDEFEEFLRSSKFDNPNNTGDLSTVRKNMGHLFFYPDSMLKYEFSQDNTYNLMLHFAPMKDNFLEVADPTTKTGWIHSIGGPDGKDNPGRRKEQLKSHARWRDYVDEKLNKTNFGSSAAELFKKESTLKNLQGISTKIKKKRAFAALAKLEDQERNEKLQAREVVNPGVDYKELNAVKKWIESDTAKEEAEVNLKNYDKCLTGHRLGDKEFNKFANWSRFSVALEDRNRRAVYSFTNKEFSQRRPKWLPKVKDDEQVSNYIFQKLPAGWNPDISLTGEDPSCWVLNVAPGTKGLKGGRAAQIVLTRRTAEICLKYRDLKVECLDKIEEKDPFFVNAKNKALSAMQRTPGSLLDKLGKVCGIENATVNTFRRAAEVRVQDSPVMKTSVQKLQSHSSQVGIKNYDRSHDTTRASFISQLSSMELPDQGIEVVPRSVREKRDKIDQLESQKILLRAKEKLIKDRFNKKEQKNQKCKLVPEERQFLQESFKDVIAPGIVPSKTFPGMI